MKTSRLLQALIVASLLHVPSLGDTGAPIDLSTPERTIDTYYRGYSTGNKSMVMATLLGGTSDLGIGIQRRYAIVAKKLILGSVAGSRPGDIEIVTHVTSRWPDKEIRTIETFYLRQFDGDWKIVGESARSFPRGVIYLGP
jgi:hypothetical protein